MGDKRTDRKITRWWTVEPSSSLSERPSGPGGSNSNSRQNDNRSLEDLMHFVFNEELLRETILGHVISTEVRNGSSRNNLCAIRLVSKSWLHTAHKCLVKSDQPLYKIRLTPQNSLNASPNVLQSGGKLLDRFTGAVTSSTRLETRVPPFSLKVCQEFFREENHSSFSNFFAGCSSGLVELELQIPENGGSMTLLFPNIHHLTFPNLLKLTIGFPRMLLQLEGEESQLIQGSNSIAVPFIQSILNGTQKLKEVLFKLTYSDGSKIPYGLRYLKFPSTVTILNVPSFEKSSQLDALLNYNLPNLDSTAFGIMDGIYRDGLIFQILDKFKSSLTKLTIGGRESSPVYLPSLFRFPYMEKLKVCVFASQFAELEEGHPPLQDLLPNLQYFCLNCQTIPKMKKWVDNSIFSNVTDLAFKPYHERGELQLGSLDLANRFPNVTTLTLEFLEVVETRELDPIFQGMTQLKEIEIQIFNRSGYTNSDHWDSILTGIPSGLVGGLRTNPEFWPNFQLPQNLPSVANLKELDCFKLISLPVTEEGSLISEVAFQFAFLRMPKLKEMKLIGDFKASPEIARIWRDQEPGRRLIES